MCIFFVIKYLLLFLLRVSYVVRLCYLTYLCVQHEIEFCICDCMFCVMQFVRVFVECMLCWYCTLLLYAVFLCWLGTRGGVLSCWGQFIKWKIWHVTIQLHNMASLDALSPYPTRFTQFFSIDIGNENHISAIQLSCNNSPRVSWEVLVLMLYLGC